MFSLSQPCSMCGGRGVVVDDPCETCGGRGLTDQVQRYRVKIPAGVREGSRIRLGGKGEPGLSGGPAGDLYVVTRVSPSPVFKQKGEHLEVDVPITIAEAVRGDTVEVPTLERHEEDPHTGRHLRGQRAEPARRGAAEAFGTGRGDIHYRFRVQIPKSLTNEQREAFDRFRRSRTATRAGAAGPRTQGGLMPDELFSQSRACS